MGKLRENCCKTVDDMMEVGQLGAGDDPAMDFSRFAQSLIEPQEDHAVIREGTDGWGWEVVHEEEQDSECSTDPAKLDECEDIDVLPPP